MDHKGVRWVLVQTQSDKAPFEYGRIPEELLENLSQVCNMQSYDYVEKSLDNMILICDRERSSSSRMRSQKLIPTPS